MTVVQSISLFFQEGGSDKVYNAALVDEGGAFTVRVEWGRRGATLSTGTKAVKTSRAVAQKAYDKVIAEKRAKGYEAITEDVAPASVAPPVGEGSGSRVSGPRRERRRQTAQLLNAIDDEALERALRDDAMIAQQKLDGTRVLIHVEESVVATNRKGELTEIARSVVEAVRGLPHGTVLDGELVGGADSVIYWVFDLLQHGVHELRNDGYLRRHARLLDVVRALATSRRASVRVVPIASTVEEKRALVARLSAERAEGVVFKHARAPYTAGRPASGGGQLKYKFVKSADVFITENAGNAYRMAVYDDDVVRPVGKVFAGTTNESRAELDERLTRGERPVAEVRYLYATDGDVLYQPVFVRLRDDKEPEDCLLSQLVRTNRAVVAEPALPAPSVRLLTHARGEQIEVEIAGSQLLVRTLRKSAVVDATTHTLASDDDAIREAELLIEAKLDEGFLEVLTGA